MNIFLYVITANPRFGPVARTLLQRIEKGEEAATLSLVIAEVYAWPESQKLDDKIDFLFETLKSCPTF